MASEADSVDRFVQALASENEAFWVDRDVRLDPGAPPEQLTSQIRYRMRQGVYNELRSVELIAAWIPTIKERDILDLLPQQLDDEQRHYQLLRRRLIDLDEDPDSYEPLPEWAALFDWLVAAKNRPTIEKLAMFQFAGETQSCAGFETLIKLAERLDPVTARLYQKEILPDECRHAAIGRRALLVLADTPARQKQAREACRAMNRRVWECYCLHRARADTKT